MTEIRHQDLEAYLTSLKAGTMPRTILIWGQEYLARNSFERILNTLLSPKEKELCYQVVDGQEASCALTVIESLTTYNLMTDKQVVTLKNLQLTSSPGKPGISKEDLESLENAIKSDFPDGHTLILTLSAIDKRRSLFKTIKEKGLIVDCSVPEGNRKVDKNEQKAIMDQLIHENLKHAGKRIEMDAARLLMERVGFDPGTLVENLEKLIVYTGAKESISIQDVRSVVRKSKKDAVFELTNALAQKDLAGALTYLNSLLSGDLHPLQVLAAITNQVRRLTLVKSFIEQTSNTNNSVWHPKTDFNQFKTRVLPEIIKADEATRQKIQTWDRMLEKTNDGIANSKSKVSTDLMLAPNPKNPYPVFQVFLKSEFFSLKELSDAIIAINEVDYKLKSSGSDPDILLENLLIRICQSGG